MRGSRKRQREVERETSKQKIQKISDQKRRKRKEIVPGQTAPQEGTFSYTTRHFSFSTIVELFLDQEVVETWRRNLIKEKSSISTNSIS